MPYRRRKRRSFRGRGGRRRTSYSRRRRVSARRTRPMRIGFRM